MLVCETLFTGIINHINDSEAESKMVDKIPNGFNTLTPFIIAPDGDRVIKFAEEAFGAKTKSCLRHKDGSVWNAELDVGTSKLLVGSAHGSQPAFPAFIYVFVEDTDKVYQSALNAGGKSLMEPSNQFYGDRNAGVMDADGNVWWIATRVEDVDQTEIQRRAAEFEKNQ